MIRDYELRQIFIVLRLGGQKDSCWIDLQNIMHLSLMLIVKSGLQKMLKQLCQRNAGGNQVKVSQIKATEERTLILSFILINQVHSI